MHSWTLSVCSWREWNKGLFRCHLWTLSVERADNEKVMWGVQIQFISEHSVSISCPTSLLLLESPPTMTSWCFPACQSLYWLDAKNLDSKITTWSWPSMMLVPSHPLAVYDCARTENQSWLFLFLSLIWPHYDLKEKTKHFTNGWVTQNILVRWSIFIWMHVTSWKHFISKRNIAAYIFSTKIASGFKGTMVEPFLVGMLPLRVKGWSTKRRQEDGGKRWGILERE